jgi:hypothetical protein
VVKALARVPGLRLAPDCCCLWLPQGQGWDWSLHSTEVWGLRCCFQVGVLVWGQGAVPRP